MGLRRLSMSPAFVPTLKEATRHINQEVAEEIRRKVLRMRTVGEVRGYLTRKVRQICPDVAMLDVRK
jgi:phosphoenolpyruvate-protein kinase (PTS system EI component)